MGNNIKNIIEINGKRYDAVSGACLGDAASSAHTTSQPASRGRSVDGFMRVSRDQARQVSKPMQPIPVVKKPVAVSSASPAAEAKHRPAHTPAPHVAPHTPQKAKTLMRSAVSKPAIKAEATLKAQARTDLLAKIPLQTVAPKISFTSINHKRHLRAERLIKSPAVSRYQPLTASASIGGQALAVHPVRPIDAITSSTQHSLAAQSVQHLPVRPATEAVRKHDIFEQALAEATSHQQTYGQPKTTGKRRARAFAFVGSAVAVLAIVAFLGYQNLPSLNLKVASYRSGLHAKLPSHEPSGFSFGSLSYQPGSVNVSFKAPESSKQFNIEQKASSWDSQALLSNFVASADSAYRTYQRAGRTVYVMGNNTATWVDSGVWYTVDGNSSLSANQLMDVVVSM